MKIGIFYIATSVYKEYFKQYFFQSLENLLPNDNKNIIMITDGGLESFKDKEPKNCKFIFEDIIDFPYPIINLCKFQIIEKYAKKYDIDTIFYFDADTIIFKKSNEFWESLKNKINDNKDKLILSYHPHYLYFDNFNFGHDYFFPHKENSCINIDNNEILKRKCYMMTSFFMCNIEALSIYAKKIYELSSKNLQNIRWIPELSDETYLNVININENQSVLLDRYITINPYMYTNDAVYHNKIMNWNGTLWENNFPNIDTIFINQKFDIKLKYNKKDI